MTLRQRVVAGSLLLGPEAKACLLTAAVLEGWRDDWPGLEVDLLLPRGDTRHQRRPGVRLHSWDVDPARVVGSHPLAWTDRTQTAYDVMRRLSRHEAVATMDAALHRGLLDPWVIGWLAEVLSSPRVAWLGLIDPRSESWLESGARLVMHDGGLHPEPQHEIWAGRVFLARVDFAFIELRLAIECQGRRYHSGEEVVVSDDRRYEAIRARGWTVLQVFVEDLRDQTKLLGRITREIARLTRERGLVGTHQ